MADDEPDSKRRVWHERALFRRPIFRSLLDVEALTQTAIALVGEDVQLLAMDLLLARTGHGGIGWHRDVTFQCDKTLSMNTGIYLQDMTATTGRLSIIPRSHRIAGGFSHDMESNAISISVPAGSAVFFDAALWHKATDNQSDANRWAVFPYFGKYFVKRMDNYFTQSLPAELLQTTDPLKRQLLGLKLRDGVPSYHGDDESYNRRGEAGIDYV